MSITILKVDSLRELLPSLSTSRNECIIFVTNTVKRKLISGWITTMYIPEAAHQSENFAGSSK